MQAKRRRRFRVTTDSKHTDPIAPNVLARQPDAVDLLERLLPDAALTPARHFAVMRRSDGEDGDGAADGARGGDSGDVRVRVRLWGPSPTVLEPSALRASKSARLQTEDHFGYARIDLHASMMPGFRSFDWQLITLFPFDFVSDETSVYPWSV